MKENVENDLWNPQVLSYLRAFDANTPTGQKR